MSGLIEGPGGYGPGGENDPFFGGAAGESAKEAAALQAATTREGIAETRRQFDITQEQFEPIRQAGLGALESQQALIGLSGEEAQQQAFDTLAESPGQKFIRERQQKALVRSSGAIGGLGGGNVRTALQEQAAGFAQQDIQNQFGRLGQIAGQGQAAGRDLGQFGERATSNIVGLQQAGGAARASGVLGAQQAQSQGANTALQIGGLALGAAFSDERLKTDKVEVGRDKSGGIYKFKYIGSNVEYIGRMAQELFMTNPDAVSLHESGYLQVSAEFAPQVA